MNLRCVLSSRCSTRRQQLRHLYIEQSMVCILPVTVLRLRLTSAQVCNWELDKKNACSHHLVGLLQMAVGKVEVLFPVEVGDIVFSCADVVANVVANRLINFRLFGCSNAL